MNLEKFLIPPEKWNGLYAGMPDYCKKVIDILQENSDCIGIGWCEEVGWFVLGAGQGPHIIWQEKKGE